MEKDYNNSNMNSNSNSNNGWNEYTNNNANNDTNTYNEQYQSNSNQEVNQYNNGYYDTHQYQDTSYRYAKEEIPQDDFMNGGQNFSEEPVSQMESEEKKPKKKSKNIVRFIAKAAAFGLIASVAFLGANAIYYRINPIKGLVIIPLQQRRFPMVELSIIQTYLV